MTAIRILYDGDDVTANVRFGDARFACSASGAPGSDISPGEFELAVRDKEHGYANGYFHVGGTMQLEIDGDIVWDGWVINVSREYAFPVDRTTDPTKTPRFWRLTGFDRNFLWSKRLYYDPTTPLNRNIGNYGGSTTDQEIVRDVLANFSDMPGDGLDLVSGIQEVGPIDPFASSFNVANPWTQLGGVIRDVSLYNGAVYFIGPDRVVYFVDDVTETAPYQLSDRPGPGQVGYRELTILVDGTQLYNDELVWGVGIGSPNGVVAHVIDTDSVTLHGRLQSGELFNGMWMQESVDRRAQTFIYGSPSHRRGHKDDVLRISCTVFEPGLRVGQGISFESEAWDGRADDIYPIRHIEITFPTPDSCRYKLTMSHEMDAPWSTFDLPPTDGGHTPDWIETVPPIPPVGNSLSWVDERDVKDFSPNIVILSPSGSVTHSMNGYSRTIGASGFDYESTIGPGTIPYYETTCDGLLGAIYDHRHVQNWVPVGIDPVTILDPTTPNPIDVASMPASWWAYTLTINSVTYTGAGSGFEIRYLVGPRDWNDLWATLPLNQNNGTSLALVSSTKNTVGPATDTDVGVYSIPTDVVQQVMSSAGDLVLWVIFTPGWQSDRPTDVAYICLPTAEAPINSGLGNSGSYAIDWGIGATWNWNYTLDSNHISDNSPRWEPSESLYHVAYPYVPGTLVITINGVTLTRGVDYEEVDPAAGTFRLLTSTAGINQEMTVHYTRTTSGPIDPLYVQPGLPADFGSNIYRPRGQRQLGWGTPYDGVNCNMTSSAMALDRHTLGAFSDISGSPLDTPPNMRNFSGVVARVGTGMEDAQRAWANGWGESLAYPGRTSWDYFVSHIQSGRGAILAGIYASLPSPYKKDSFDGPHALYINEQLPDGSFWGYDPLYRAPLVYPYSVMFNYAASLHGSGAVVAAYTRITPTVA